MSENNKHHASLKHELFKHFPFSLVLSALKKKKKSTKKSRPEYRRRADGSKGMKRYSLWHDYDLNKADEEED